MVRLTAASRTVQRLPKEFMKLGISRRSSSMWLTSCLRVRCRSVRDLFLLVVFFTLLTCYISVHFGSTWRQVAPQQGGQLPNNAVSKALKRTILAQLGSHERTSPSKMSSQSNSTSSSSHLERLLMQIEGRWLLSMKGRKKTATIRGHRSVISRDLPLYQWALEKHGFLVQSPPWYRQQENVTYRHLSKSETADKTPHQDDTDDWLLQLCMAFTEGPCLDKAGYSQLRDYQKVNRFPGMRNVLVKRDSLCATTTMAKQLSEMRHHQTGPLCFVLPGQYQQFINVAEALGYSAQWLLKPLSTGGRGETGPRVVDVFSAMGMAEVQEYSIRRAVVQQLVTNSLTVFGQPVSARLYVLVTSMAPLRAYLHSEGLVHHRYDHSKNFRKIAGRTWLLSELWQYIARNYGVMAVKTALANLYQVLVQILVIAESIVLGSNSSLSSGRERPMCHGCFQLLGFDVIFNTSFFATILEVNGQPNLQESQREERKKVNRVKRAVVDDMMTLLFTPTPVAKEVSEALSETGDELGILDFSCRISSDMCLSREDLRYLLDSRREAVNQGGYRQIYPATDVGRYGGLLDQLRKVFAPPQAESSWVEDREMTRHTSADLHRLLTALERWYNRPMFEEYYNDIDAHSGIMWRGQNLSDITGGEMAGAEMMVEDTHDMDGDETRRRSCSDDPSTVPYLSSLFVEPPIKVTPPFSAMVTEYYANVSYDDLLIKVGATSQNCQTEVRIDDRFGPSRPTNYTLGVGDNRINFLVVDITHTEPWVVNTYALIVRRLPVTHGEPSFVPKNPHQICSLKQECEMLVFPNELCGIQRENCRAEDWKTYLEHHNRLPACCSGDSPGRWVLPCETCANKKTCYWQEAVWHPHHCRYGAVSRAQLSRCLSGKKLMFIGDSTNRGMMHYLMERLNGTLTEWDKTHDIRVYTNINGGQTSVSFAYYPQFWLPTNRRPVFDKALYQLIQRSRPLENNSNTILVVGGVHWLATQHLHMLIRAIRVERLHGIRLMMKTLGAGFHQPVEGVHSLSMEDQRKLLLHSMGLADFAKHYNFEVIDTFNITVPRYKDFTQGKCACHFHRVVERATNEEPMQSWRSRRLPVNRELSFHVEGPINAIYSEILLSRLCSDDPSNR